MNSSTPWAKADERVHVTMVCTRGSDSRVARTSSILVAEVTLWTTASTRRGAATVVHLGASASTSETTQGLAEEVAEPSRVFCSLSVLTRSTPYPTWTNVAI